MLVEINLGILPFAGLVAKAGLEDVAVLDANVLSGKVERHFDSVVKVLKMKVVVEGRS